MPSIPSNLTADSIWASHSERVYVLRVGKSRNIHSAKIYVDFYVPGIGEKWLKLSEFLSRYSFFALPRLTFSEICSDQNLVASSEPFTPRLL